MILFSFESFGSILAINWLRGVLWYNIMLFIDLYYERENYNWSNNYTGDSVEYTLKSRSERFTCDSVRFSIIYLLIKTHDGKTWEKRTS